MNAAASLRAIARKRLLGQLIVKIKHTHNRELIDTFNALSLPKGYVCIADGLVHVVLINPRFSTDWRHDDTVPVPAIWTMGIATAQTADVIWFYDSLRRTWEVYKDRTDEYSSRVAKSSVKSLLSTM